MEQKTEPDLSREAFRAWLQQHEPNTTVGITRRSCDCPMARYLKSLGYTNAAVGVDAVYQLDQNNPATVGEGPDWMKCFIDKADDFGFGWQKVALRADEALAILDTI